jgi:cell shape-determining protein MreC
MVIGSNTQPIELIRIQSTQIESLKKENEEIKKEMEKQKIESYEEEIKKLKDQLLNSNSNNGGKP